MPEFPALAPASRGRIPMPVKLAYTAFVAVLVPTYLSAYGPTNFLYFCDQSLLLTLVGIWLESPLLVAMCAVGLVAPQLLWVLDFLGTALGCPITGMTAYMFDRSTAPFLRGLSGFHGWLPFLLIYLVGRLGYDCRALPTWTALAIVTLLACFFLMPPPTPEPGLTPVNINYVWGMSDRAAQTWVPAWAWLAGLIVGLPTLLFLPTHLALRRWAPARSRPAAG
ncbi:hypothetical protein FV232_18555 [Methylobacterium sp. WL30]|jgi:hypothetical protein|uniref:hypothetical protein n=1 Tax=unclassified Methylobacterium TaxID=2615210 RepID=UPI0011CAE0C7|nr:MULTISPECIES: hypothetical protein [unclassified Methylobacterium]MCJ2075579.1 hypothetical protein [Methylobacterium sp. E-016]TXN19699.1 hypothetical protein FV225_28165 [Methylobacterium sp. WL93]TXN43663.1 hypothetical protein FV227_27685 [Methylobacterium sp. WL119]TXN65342.1 hypothetical protein FV232_18555 [Methylobacterium sp. WL30]